jgi:hypothetical protein
MAPVKGVFRAWEAMNNLFLFVESVGLGKKLCAIWLRGDIIYIYIYYIELFIILDWDASWDPIPENNIGIL